MSQGTNELIENLSRLIDRRTSLLRTATMGRVTALDLGTWRATIQPMIKEPINGSLIILAPIPGVPVWRPRSGGVVLSLPLSVGDTGLLIILDRASGEFKRLGGVVDPVDARHHDLTDCIFLPGFVGPWDEDLAEGPTPAGAVIQSSVNAGLMAEDEGEGFSIEGSLTVVTGDNVRLGARSATNPVALSVATNSNFDLLKTAFNSWTPVPGDGGAALKVLLTALLALPWPTSVSATKVKAV